jgi:hypothetical protein
VLWCRFVVVVVGGGGGGGGEEEKENTAANRTYGRPTYTFIVSHPYYRSPSTTILCQQ